MIDPQDHIKHVEERQDEIEQDFHENWLISEEQFEMELKRDWLEKLRNKWMLLTENLIPL